MKQVIVIHGGTTFASYDNYLDYLSTKEISIEHFIHTPMWKETLQEKLGTDYQVLLPSMPNKTNARYDEWKLWFDRIAEIAEDDCIVIGHSLGGIFLVKYLSENKFPKKIAATIIIAAPFNDEEGEELTDFKIDSIADEFSKHAGKVIFFYGFDDPVVPAHEADKYRNKLSNAEFYQLSAPDHFVRTDFPELVSGIRRI